MSTLLMIEKCIRGRICHAIDQYVEANKKYMQNYYKNKEPSYLKYWNVNDLCVWTMSQKLPVNDFKWVADACRFTKDFIGNCNEDSD